MGVLAYAVTSFGGLVFLPNCFNLPADAAFFDICPFKTAFILSHMKERGYGRRWSSGTIVSRYRMREDYRGAVMLSMNRTSDHRI